jgi:hypothetical protein
LDRNYAYQPYASPSVQPGGYHAREGFPTNLPPPVRRGPRMYLPNTKWTWAFLITAVVQAAVALTLEAYVNDHAMSRVQGPY